MYTVKTLNKISQVITKILPPDRYAVSPDAPSPHAVLVRSAAMHDLPVPESLVAVARAGAGVNNIPVDAYTKLGIAVFNTPGANANAVAELTLLGLLLSGRKVAQGIAWASSLAGQEGVAALVEKGKGRFIGPELKGKTLGVVGLGAIGGIVANAAVAGLGMRVLGLDPGLTVQRAWSLSPDVGRAESLESLLKACDFVTLHLPLSGNTRGMIGEAQLSLMKPGAALVNFSRAELVDNRALRAALESGRLSAYVTDFPTDDLEGAEGVVCIPHLGASTPESEENCAAMAANQLRAYLETGAIENSVNLPAVAPGPLEGSRILIIHVDGAGLSGQLTDLLTQRGAPPTSLVSRSRGDVAVTLADLAVAPDEDALSALAALPGVARVRLLAGP